MIWKVVLVVISIVGGEPKGATVGEVSSWEECTILAQETANLSNEGMTLYTLCLKYPLKGKGA